MLMVVLLVTSCGRRRATVEGKQPDFLVSPVLLEANFYAGDVLSTMLEQRLPPSSGILVANLVNLDATQETSALGRVATQQIASRLTQQGFRVIEARLGSNLLIEEHEGEFMLSRDVAKLLTADHDAAAVLLGTYRDAGDGLFISVRVVGLLRNTIIAAHEYYLPFDGEVEHLHFSNYEKDSRVAFQRKTAEVWQSHAKRQNAFKRVQAPQSSKAALAPKQPTAPKQLIPAKAETSAALPEKQVKEPFVGKKIDPDAPVTPFPKSK